MAGMYHSAGQRESVNGRVHSLSTAASSLPGGAAHVLLALAAYPVAIAVEAVRVWRQNAKPAVRNVLAAEIGRWWRDANIWVGRVAVPGWLLRRNRRRLLRRGRSRTPRRGVGGRTRRSGCYWLASWLGRRGHRRRWSRGRGRRAFDLGRMCAGWRYGRFARYQQDDANDRYNKTKPAPHCLAPYPACGLGAHSHATW